MAAWRRERTTQFAAASAIATAALVGCGDSHSLERSDLPAPLAKVLPRLERAGLDVEPRELPPSDTPALLVDADSPQPALLVAAAKGRSGTLGFPSRVRNVDAEFDIEVACGDRVSARAPTSHAASQVLKRAGLYGGCE